LPRIDGAERSPSSQARCRQCHEPIEREAWRIRLVFHQEGNFSPGGFIHLACAPAYIGGADTAERVLHFTADLPADEREHLQQELAKALS
jgi:hypothetical protein